jgi:Pao retrotransposon peptidase
LVWDKEVQEIYKKKWLVEKESVINIKEIKINQSISRKRKWIILRGFCNASAKAICCCIYTVEMKSGETNMLFAKSKIKKRR